MEHMNFQPILDRLTHILIKTKLIDEFLKKDSSEDRIRFCLSHPSIQYGGSDDICIGNEIEVLLSAFKKESSKHRKCEEMSLKLKDLGSKAFLKKRDKEAHLLYTDALRHARSTAPICALLYANRSATLFQMGSYKDCLHDIERAEKSGYPAEMMHKLLKRKASCFAHLGKHAEAFDAFELYKKFLSDALPGNKDRISSTIESLKEELASLKIAESPLPPSVEATLPPLYLGESSSVSSMSSSLIMRYNDMEGRHIIAKQSIPKGSVAFVERPFACILLTEYFLTHCQKCLVPTDNPLPCDLCRDVVWCSEGCKRQGDSYHRYECGILHILSGVGIAHLALRIVLTAGWKTCMKVKQESASMNESAPACYSFRQRDGSSSYRAVHSLLTHLDKVTPEDNVQYCLAALILGQTLVDQWPSFFEDDPPRSGACDETLVQLSSVLVHHVAQLVSNAHAVTQVSSTNEDKNESFLQVSQKRMASAIYPSASLMNHSCSPSIINSFHKEVLVIHTIKDVEKGQQLHNCYGPHACRQEREERQQVLKRQYFFTCKCPHCTQEEHLRQEGNWSGIKCPSCDGIAKWDEDSGDHPKGSLRCLDCCKVAPPPKDIVESCSIVNMHYEASEQALSKGLFEQAESDLESALETAVSIYTEGNLFLTTMRDNLAKVYAMTGRYKDSLLQLSLCIRVVEARYGSDSIEVAHELVKYVDLLKMAHKDDANSSQKEIGKIRKRINRIFILHYGHQWRSYLKIQDF